jgi:hypothetical protein
LPGLREGAQQAQPEDLPLQAEVKFKVGMTGVFRKALSVAACVVVSSVGAQAIELDGAWANDRAVCSKVFARQGNRVLVARDADSYGSGFVVKDGQIRGNIVTCSIKSRKEDGAVLHLHTSCSTDVALQDVQFSVRPDNDDTITRIFAGLPELDRTYYRCKFDQSR